MIVGSILAAGILAQLCEDPGLLPVVEGLARSEGAEFHLKLAGNYIVPGRSATMATVVEAAARRGEVAIGYWLDRSTPAGAAQAGLKLNPHKSVDMSLGHRDRVVVLARDTT